MWSSKKTNPPNDKVTLPSIIYEEAAHSPGEKVKFKGLSPGPPSYNSPASMRHRTHAGILLVAKCVSSLRDLGSNHRGGCCDLHVGPECCHSPPFDCGLQGVTLVNGQISF